jgi:hypothetical protein
MDRTGEGMEEQFEFRAKSLPETGNAAVAG